MGLGLSFVPDALASMSESIQLIFGDSGLVLVAIIVVVLNIVLPKEEKEIEERVNLETQTV